MESKANTTPTFHMFGAVSVQCFVGLLIVYFLFFPLARKDVN